MYAIIYHNVYINIYIHTICYALIFFNSLRHNLYLIYLTNDSLYTNLWYYRPRKNIHSFMLLR